jgi:hypothetical protein
LEFIVSGLKRAKGWHGTSRKEAKNTLAGKSVANLEREKSAVVELWIHASNFCISARRRRQGRTNHPAESTASLANRAGGGAADLVEFCWFHCEEIVRRT